MLSTINTQPWIQVQSMARVREEFTATRVAEKFEEALVWAAA